MAIITAPNAGYNDTVAGVTFVDGVGETVDETALAYFKRQGYDVTGPPDLPAEVTWDLTKDPVEMTKPELLAFVAHYEIDLDGATTKAQILDVIDGWEPPEDDGDPEA